MTTKLERTPFYCQLWKVNPEWYNSAALIWGAVVDEAIQEFLRYLKDECGRRENTLLAYKSDLDQLLAIWKQTATQSEPNTISVEIIERYVEWLLAQGYKASTIARKCIAVRSFIEFWKIDGILPLTYIDNLIRDIQKTKQPPKVLSREQIEDLLAAPTKLQTPIGLRDTAILSLMYKTGLRATDVIQLTLEDVDLILHRIRIKSIGMNPLPLGEVTEKIIHYLMEGRPHLARIPEERSLFINQRGKGLTRQGLWFIVRRWADEAELGDWISPNIIRHSLIRHLMDSGLSNKEILHRLGLKSPNSLRAFTRSLGKVSDK